MKTRNFTSADIIHFLNLDKNYQQYFDNRPAFQELQKHLTSEEELESFLAKNQKVARFLNSNPQFQQSLRVKDKKQFFALEKFYKYPTVTSRAVVTALQSPTVYSTFDLTLEEEKPDFFEKVGQSIDNTVSYLNDSTHTFFSNVAITSAPTVTFLTNYSFGVMVNPSRRNLHDAQAELRASFLSP